MTEQERIKSQKERLDSYLRASGKRVTQERHAVIEAVLTAARPVSAGEVRSILEAQGYRVSSGTVYSALNIMVEASLLRRAMVEWGRSATTVYEPASENPSTTLVCTDCGAMREVRDAELQNLINRRRYPRFQQVSAVVYIYGQCSKCLRRHRTALQKEKELRNNPQKHKEGHARPAVKNKS